MHISDSVLVSPAGRPLCAFSNYCEVWRKPCVATSEPVPNYCAAAFDIGASSMQNTVRATQISTSDIGEGSYFNDGGRAPIRVLSGINLDGGFLDCAMEIMEGPGSGLICALVQCIRGKGIDLTSGSHFVQRLRICTFKGLL